MLFTPSFLSSLQGDAAPTRTEVSQGLHLLPEWQIAPQDKDTTIVIQFYPYFYLLFSFQYYIYMAFSSICLIWAPRAASKSKVAFLLESYL